MYFLSPQDMIEIKRLTINLKLKEIFEKPPYRLGNNIPVETYHSILIMRSPDGAEYHWRFRTNMIEQQSIGNILSLFPQKHYWMNMRNCMDGIVFCID